MDDVGEATRPLVDDEVIESLRGVFGPRTSELLDRTRGLLDERAARLRGMTGDGGDDLARLAHEIGGMAGQVGLARLSDAARRLEARLRAGDRAPGAAHALASLADESLTALPAG